MAAPRRWCTLLATVLVCSSFYCCRSTKTLNEGSGSAAQPGVVKVHRPTGLFVDSTTERVMFFHGVNVVSKLPPYLPNRSASGHGDSVLSDDDLKSLHDDWGFNAIRLGVMWVAVEPENNTVNKDFLQAVRNLTDDFFSYGIYTLIDGHQDLIGPDMCGEGHPLWATHRSFDLKNFDLNGSKTRFPLPLDFKINRDPKTGFPDRSQCAEHLFVDFYSTDAVSTAFGSLYSETEMQQYYADYWGILAETFRESVGVLAYEILNEPGPDKLGIFLPSDRQQLFPLYNVTHHKIREVDDEHIIFYEGVPTDQYVADYLRGTSDLMSPSGPGGSIYADREAFAFHLYCPPNTFEILCNTIIDLTWSWLERSKQRMTTGTHASILTEFGAVGNDPASIRLLDRVTTAADENLQSWFYWTFKSFGDFTTQNHGTETFFFPNGTLQKEKVRALSTTYPHKVAGLPASVRFSFDRSSGDFVLNYTTAAGTSLCPSDNSTTTEIFLNEKMHYPRGFDVRITGAPKNTMWWPVKDNYIIVTHPCAAKHADAQNMTVHIAARA